ncbi:penicillin-binding protein 2 [Pantoea sp. Mhis]|uniref:penicillin-binding protein 2 n=1 Tax=Pantoea sp. Mhis TaxID=2576759 RepID=UPI001358247E|nr:penicillin-binding protein 2 [Pantoea sp. Mhis]MXP56268.1 penicillin-binding protein 2 [Pantoea sp. Mhis]
MKFHKNIFHIYSEDQKLFTHRILIAFILVLLLCGILIFNLYYLQIICFESYSSLSNKNYIKLMPISPKRGIIFDRNNTPIALNLINYQAEIRLEKLDSLKNSLQDLRSILDLTDEDINKFKEKIKHAHIFTPIPIKTSLNDIQIARFAVNQHRFPNIAINGYQYRYYPYGNILTHVIGYVAKINSQDIRHLNQIGKWSNYRINDSIGKLGIESYYENILHGKIGYKQIEVNNRGHIIREWQKQSPVAGSNLYLTIDIKLQEYITTLLNNNIHSRAAVVVNDPRTGELLALVSTPNYNPNLFVKGISNKAYKELINNKENPLYNRAIQAVYPPASTVKPYIAISALSSGIIKKNTSLFDPGWWRLPGSSRYYHDWKKSGHGYLNVTKSLTESADTFFYQIAYHMGIDRLSEWMNKFGYGYKTGIDLPEENSGNMPTRKWKRNTIGESWYHGDTVAVGIGQGYWSATPLQMNNAMMILINNGIVKRPYILSSIRKGGKQIIPYRVLSKLPIDNMNSEYWEIVKNAMYRVANKPNGTAYKNFSNAPYKIAAKSGTAQIFSLKKNEIYNARKIALRLRDNKLMTAFAPYDKPRVVVTMILENANNSHIVGNTVRQILDYVILGDKHISKIKKK